MSNYHDPPPCCILAKVSWGELATNSICLHYRMGLLTFTTALVMPVNQSIQCRHSRCFFSSSYFNGNIPCAIIVSPRWWYVCFSKHIISPLFTRTNEFFFFLDGESGSPDVHRGVYCSLLYLCFLLCNQGSSNAKHLSVSAFTEI